MIMIIINCTILTLILISKFSSNLLKEASRLCDSPDTPSISVNWGESKGCKVVQQLLASLSSLQSPAEQTHSCGGKNHSLASHSYPEHSAYMLCAFVYLWLCLSLRACLDKVPFARSGFRNAEHSVQERKLLLVSLVNWSCSAVEYPAGWLVTAALQAPALPFLSSKSSMQDQRCTWEGEACFYRCSRADGWRLCVCVCVYVSLLNGSQEISVGCCSATLNVHLLQIILAGQLKRNRVRAFFLFVFCLCWSNKSAYWGSEIVVSCQKTAPSGRSWGSTLITPNERRREGKIAHGTKRIPGNINGIPGPAL